MKQREEFYKDNIEAIEELENKVYDLWSKMEKECGEQSGNEYLKTAWVNLFVAWMDNK